MWEENMFLSSLSSSPPYSLQRVREQAPGFAGVLLSTHIFSVRQRSVKILVCDQLVADVRALKSQGSELGHIRNRLHSHMFLGDTHMKKVLCNALGIIIFTPNIAAGYSVISGEEKYIHDGVY